MGYRAQGELWLKPVGYSLFVYSPEKRIWKCLFQSASGNNLLCWDGHEFEGEPKSFIEKIKTWEAASRTSINPESSFEFLTFQEALGVELDL